MPFTFPLTHKNYIENIMASYYDYFMEVIGGRLSTRHVSSTWTEH